MSDNRTPSNFITPKSIDNLSIAGICVWILCLTASSFSTDLNSFCIRIIAFSFSFLWSISLFIRKKDFKSIPNYIILFVNAALIYVNAAGMNTVTRQSPFEGFGVKPNPNEHSEALKQVNAGVLDLSSQKNWYPDYKMLRQIDTLKEEVIVLNDQKQRLLNEFSYIKDKIYNVSKDSLTSSQIKSFLKDFGHYVDDTTSYAIMKSEYIFLIDSIKSALDFREKHPITQTTYYTIGGRQISAEQYVKLLLDENVNTTNALNVLLNNSRYSNQQVDSIARVYNLKLERPTNPR